MTASLLHDSAHGLKTLALRHSSTADATHCSAFIGSAVSSSASVYSLSMFLLKMRQKSSGVAYSLDLWLKPSDDKFEDNPIRFVTPLYLLASEVAGTDQNNFDFCRTPEDSKDRE
jgi:hypothetical protein